jgi:hypothetical protein
MTNTPKEQALEEELSAALATVAMLEEDGERLEWIQVCFQAWTPTAHLMPSAQC